MAQQFLFPDTAILVFCKAPVPGRVKTRLMPNYSSIQAAQIHRRLTENLLNKLAEWQISPTQLWCSPHENYNFFRYCRHKYLVSLHHQQGNDLGHRMLNALSTALLNFRHALIIGCDCPVFEQDYFLNAIQALQNNHDLVLGPAEDGGYVMIGMNTTHTQIFKDIEWGTSSVSKHTLDKASKLNLNVCLLPELWDIDYPHDISKLGNLVIM